MTVLRELVAKLGFQVETKQFDQASKSVDQIKQAVRGVDGRLRDARGRFVAAGGAAQKMGAGAVGAQAALAGLNTGAQKLQSTLLQLGLGLGLGAIGKKMIEMASDANETENVLGEVFGSQGANQVKQWAKEQADYLGRSEYALRKNAGALGAMLEPMTGSAEKAQEMSTNMSALAVDLASFFNATDDAALVALKAGISGESEPLKRFGIVMQDATLQEFALANGITKKVQAMNVAEKTDLRYQFILAKTTKAQGDAHRTADGFANSSRALGDHLLDVGTHIGQKLLPAAQLLITWSNRAISAFDKFGAKSYFVETALALLTAGFIALKAQAALAVIVPLLGFLALALAIDDVVSLLTGGESALGDFLDATFGFGTAQDLVQGFHDALDSVTSLWGDLADLWQQMPEVIDWWDVLTSEAENFGIAVARVFQSVDELVQKAIDKLGNLGRGFARLLGFDVQDQQESAAGRATGRGVGAGTYDSVGDELEARRDETFGRLQRERYARAKAKAELRARAYASGRGVDAATREAGKFVAPGAAGAGAAASASTTVNNGPVNINIGQGVGAADAARAARRAVDAERRRTQAALRRSG